MNAVERATEASKYLPTRERVAIETLIAVYRAAVTECVDRRCSDELNAAIDAAEQEE